jgi:hypothetical protein
MGTWSNSTADSPRGATNSFHLSLVIVGVTTEAWTRRMLLNRCQRIVQTQPLLLWSSLSLSSVSLVKREKTDSKKYYKVGNNPGIKFIGYKQSIKVEFKKMLQAALTC